MVALLLQAMAGHPWQLDLHMYFFAALAVLSVYCDWRVLIAAAGATALHHLALNLLLPAAVYPDGADLGRVVLHAVIVVLETAALAWLAAQLVGLFTLSARSIAAADAARAAETEAHAREIAGESEARAARRRTADELAERFEGSVDHLVRQAAETAARVRHASQDLSNAAAIRRSARPPSRPPRRRPPTTCAASPPPPARSRARCGRSAATWPRPRDRRPGDRRGGPDRPDRALAGGGRAAHRADRDVIGTSPSRPTCWR